LLKLVAGLVEPQRGRVLIGGKDFRRISRKERAAVMRSMGMLFQKNALFDSLTVGENLAFPLRETTGLKEPEIQEKVREFLAYVELSHARDLFPDEISGGMQKRVGIARALILNPEIILYDDPTAGLDPITSRVIIELIIRLNRQFKTTVLAVTNDMNRAYQMADQIGMVVDHTVILTGDVEATQRNPDPRVQQFIHGALEGPLTAATESDYADDIDFRETN
jgi:phospholipid/cholesterol/gamma-HCH transport system ATP-binding protein